MQLGATSGDRQSQRSTETHFAVALQLESLFEQSLEHCHFLRHCCGSIRLGLYIPTVRRDPRWPSRDLISIQAIGDFDQIAERHAGPLSALRIEAVPDHGGGIVSLDG